jgi:hypothetical protein
VHVDYVEVAVHVGSRIDQYLGNFVPLQEHGDHKGRLPRLDVDCSAPKPGLRNFTFRVHIGAMAK